MVERLRDAMLDYDIIVDDARAELETALARLRISVRERDDIAQRLLETLDAERAA